MINHQLTSADEPLETVDVKDVAALTASKFHLYRALLIKGKYSNRIKHGGKLFLPPYRGANISFLRQILSGEKKYYLQAEIPSVRVLRHKQISVDKVLKIVRKNKEMSQYLPDYEEGESKRIDRDFLFALVNKMDPDFFARANKQIEQRALNKLNVKKPAQTLKIRSELMSVLQQAKSMNTSNKSKSSERALVSMLATTKKRKRADMQSEDDLDLTFMPKKMRT